MEKPETFGNYDILEEDELTDEEVEQIKQTEINKDFHLQEDDVVVSENLIEQEKKEATQDMQDLDEQHDDIATEKDEMKKINNLDSDDDTYMKKFAEYIKGKEVPISKYKEIEKEKEYTIPPPLPSSYITINTNKIWIAGVIIFVLLCLGIIMGILITTIYSGVGNG